jgi:hypothetical protein
LGSRTQARTPRGSSSSSASRACCATNQTLNAGRRRAQAPVKDGEFQDPVVAQIIASTLAHGAAQGQGGRPRAARAALPRALLPRATLPRVSDAGEGPWSVALPAVADSDCSAPPSFADDQGRHQHHARLRLTIAHYILLDRAHKTLQRQALARRRSASFLLGSTELKPRVQIGDILKPIPGRFRDHTTSQLCGWHRHC